MSKSRRGWSFVPTVADLSDGALHCHVYGHQWQEGPVQHGILPKLNVSVWVMKVHCVSCQKDRSDYLEPETFELLWRQYSNAPGYRVAEPAVRTDFRKETVARNYNKQQKSGRRRGIAAVAG